MRRPLRKLAGAAGMVLLISSAAFAGPYADDLSKCLVSSTTEKDKTDLIRWMFSAIALHPDVKGIASVSDKQRTEMTRTVGQLFERLLTDSCGTQYRDAMKYEGNGVIETSFAVLGQVAMRKLVEDPAVGKGLGEIQNYVDEQKLASVLQSAKK